jgi:hypothetical protein
LSDDPEFVTSVLPSSAPTVTGDYRLQATSPAIDAGDNSVVSVASDLAGNVRRSDMPNVADTGNGTAPIVDMGAYEVGAPFVPNQAPTLDQPGDLTLLEDAGLQTITLSGLGTGAGEAEQVLTITATSDNPVLIPNPAVNYSNPSASGSVSFTPLANANGMATITITVQDSGGTTGGGVDTLIRSFMVQITPVNDAPAFTAGPNQSIQSSAGAQTIMNWASGFTPGPADEAGQTMLGYLVVANSAPELFTGAPVIDMSGTLTYTPKPGVSGIATISLVVRDSGGTANDGVDISTVRTFTIAVGGGYQVYLPLVLR